MDASLFEIVGHYSVWTGEISKFRVDDILRDKEFNYWYKIDSEPIEYPRLICSVSQVAKTAGFHSVNKSSILLPSTIIQIRNPFL